MLDRVYNTGKYRIYKRGIGYVYKLNMINRDWHGAGRRIHWQVVKDFTDISYIRFAYLWTFKRLEIPIIINEILKFNIKKYQRNNGTGIDKDIEIVISETIDLFSSQYGWTIDYILENITYECMILLGDAIKQRRASEISIATICAHSPAQAQKIIDEYSGIERMSYSEFVQKRRREWLKKK